MKNKSKQIQLNKKQKKYMQKTKQYRVIKISVVKMKQRLKSKRNTNQINHRQSKQNTKLFKSNKK